MAESRPSRVAARKEAFSPDDIKWSHAARMPKAEPTSSIAILCILAVAATIVAAPILVG